MKYLAVLVSVLAVVAATQQENLEDDLTHEGRMIKQAKYQPGYVAAALADAYADVLRAKAQHKYNQSLPNITLTQAMPVPAGPSKSKTFAYTNIRLTAQATGEAPPPPPPPQAGPSFFQTVPSPFVTQQLPSAAAVSGARESPFVTSSAAVPASPFVTQQQQGVVPPLTTTAAVASPADLEAKLADLQAQLKQLQDLEDQIMAMKAGSTRRLLDSGLPGWDNGVLMQKKLDIMQQTASLLRDKISSDMAALQDRMMVAGDISTGSAEIVTDYVSDAMYNKQVAWEAATDAWRAQAEANAGSFQDLIGGIMEAHADAFRTLWGL